MPLKIHHFLILVFGLMFTSCGENRIPEGEIEYEITYPYVQISGFMSAILPKTMTVTFKGTKILTTIARGNMFTTQIVSDETSQLLEMRLDFGDKLFYTELSKEDLDNLIASQPNYIMTETTNEDSVKGMWSKCYKVVCDKDSVVHSDAWFTNDLAPTNAYWYSSYKDIQGVPLIYDVERYDIIMHVEAVNFTKRKVKDKEFKRDRSLVKIPFDQYEREVQELFDILMK